MNGSAINRPHQRQLQQPNRGAITKTQIGEGLTRILIGFTGGDDADAGARRVHHHSVNAIGAGIIHRRRQADGKNPGFLFQRHIGQTNAGIGVIAVGQPDTE